MKKIKRIFLILIISGIVSLICNVDFVKDNHFNLITINAVLIGFLFTSLSIMLGFLKEEIIQLFEKAGALKKVYESIEYGIEYGVYSIIVSLFNMLMIEKYLHQGYLLNYLYSIEIVLLLVSIYRFLITLSNIKIVVESIRFDNLNKKEKKKVDEEIEDVFKYRNLK
ncbi:hypothetical protein KQH81_10825 [Clostridium cadaveris]|uniref:hypothetical protein n=1 Tax=Clostridium cadaveris TaxID=1529 RepID=UPI001E406710|nr:hypothetical protein [Clostridium cadaveris]UFH63849.1 hypothetical protein KQH81_10825 [Clostridium cadaveris]